MMPRCFAAFSFAVLPMLLVLPMGSVAAQVPPAIPHPRTLDVLVVDSIYDGVWRLADFDLDGDYNDSGEIISYYSDVIGALPWSSPTAIVCGAEGTVYVTDIGNDAVYALRDGNGDGDANDAGEHRVFFDGTSASGFPIPQAYGLTIDAFGRLFLAVNNASSPAGPDLILMLRDLNGDGDAQDANEAVDYYNRPGTTGALATSIPIKVIVGPDGFVYFTEVGTGFTKGVWRLEDGNGNGHCNDPGEATVFWTPPFTASPQYWSLCIDGAGYFIVTDHGNETVWRGQDANTNGTIEPSEQTLFYQTPGSSWWDAAFVSNSGTVLLVDSETPHRVTALRDGNGDGDALDSGESAEAYQSGLASVAINVRGAALLRGPWLEASPALVPIGTSTNVVTHAAKPFDLCLEVISTGLGPAFPLPPWGIVEIDIGAFHSIGAGFADANAVFTVPLTVPNNPALVGNAYAFQALSGDSFRLFLSAAASVVVTP